jgi:hypothetical protein
MKTAKLVIGIISIVLSIIVFLQSFFVGAANTLGEALDQAPAEASGSAGAFLAFCMLIAGIIGIATRNSRNGGFTAGGFYVFAAIIGFAGSGSYTDLVIWSIVSLAFGIVFILGSRKMPKPVKG